MPDSDKIQYADKDSYFSKLSVWLTIIATVAVTAFLILLGVTENTEVTQIRQENGYTCVEDYHCQEITDDNAPIGVRKEYTFTLDNNIATDTTLAFYTVHQYVEVWLGEEKVFSIMPSKDNHMIKTVGSNWTIYQDRLFKDLAQLILGIMAVFIGVVFVCVAAYNLNKKKREKSLFALGFFSVMMGFWRLTDTRFTPFLLKDKPLLFFFMLFLWVFQPFIFEFKLDKSAAEALEQIEEQQYALPYQNGKRKVHKIGVNISSASRTVDEWVVVD